MILRSPSRFNIASVAGKTGTCTNGGTVKVPAGNFASIFKVNSEMKVFGKTYKSNTWAHSAIPINKVVKSVTEGTSTMELLKFGNNAVSQF